MLRSVNNLIGYQISAMDGDLGKAYDFYFDDLAWSIRFLVVETGSLFDEKKVLIPHAALGATDWGTQRFQVNLTMEQVRKSPDIETEKTISRQHEINLFNYYALPEYWKDGLYAGSIGMGPLTAIVNTETLKEAGDSVQRHHGEVHLRSTKKVTGFHIHAKDGEVGHVADFIIDDKKWDIFFLVVDTQNWLPGKKVLILPKTINRIDWEESEVYVNLTQASIEKRPELDPAQPVGEDYIKVISDHYENFAYKL